MTSKRQQQALLQQAHGLARRSLLSAALSGWQEGIAAAKAASQQASRAMQDVAMGMQRGLQQTIITR